MGWNKTMPDHSYYDFFLLKLESVQLQYFSSMNFFYNYLKFQNGYGAQKILNNPILKDSIKIDIIEKFSIQVQIQLIKKNVDAEEDLHQNKVELLLPYMNISITPVVLESIKSFNTSLASIQSDTNLSNLLYQEKQQILKFSLFKGQLKQRGTYFRSWTTYYSVMSGQYIYLYMSEVDLEYNHYLCLKDAKVQECEDIGVPYSFKVLILLISLDKCKQEYYLFGLQISIGN